MVSQIKQAILQTLAYADIFDYPLTEKEIWARLVNAKCQILNVKFAIEHLKLISNKNGFYFLKSRESLVQTRKNRRRWSEIKLEIAKKVARYLHIIPTIKLVGVSGGLAVYNAREKDDIDFFIITSKNRVWTTRFLTTVLVEVLGRRRRPSDRKVNNKICLNMFIDEDCLSIVAKERDIYRAYEIIQMKPLWEKEGVYKRFIQENLWVKDYLPNAVRIRNYESKTRQEKLQESLLYQVFRKLHVLIIIFFDFTEMVLKKFQLWYMRERRTREILTDNVIRFHPKDADVWVLEKFRQKKMEVKFS